MGRFFSPIDFIRQVKRLAKRGRVYNPIFNQSEWDQVNQTNKDLMEDYKMELKQNQKSDNTIDQYWNDWRIVMIYIYRKLNNASILDLNKKDFRRFSLWVTEELKVSNARHNRLMSAMRSLLTYCENDDDIKYDNNVSKKVKGLPKKEVREIIFLSDEQVMKLKNELLKRENYQDALLLMLAYDSCGRKNELFQVTKECFLNPERRFTNKVIGKRGKEFPLVYFDETYRIAQLYLNQRGEDDIKELWISGTGENKRSILVDALYKRFLVMNDLLENLEGKEIGFNVHSFRHSALENYSTGEHYMCKILNKPDGFRLEELQILAHHESSNTTASYLKDKSDQILEGMFGIKLG